MPAPQAHLDLVDAAELAELLTFISQWLGGTDHTQLAASFGRFIGTPGYDLAGLRTDLARFTFLLGHDDGEQLFGHDEGEQPFGTGEDRPASSAQQAGRATPRRTVAR